MGATRPSRSVRRRRRASQSGYALLALIFALMVMAVMMMSAVPDAITQAKREREQEMIFRGEAMAEAIARYYAGGGRLGPAGLVVKTPPPAYGYLTELKKLRDGVTIGSQEIFFVRSSAMIDPLTNDDWEPVRVGDPRLRKFFRAWQQFTGRQLPPIYASYIGSASTLDTTDHSKDEDGEDLDDNDSGDDDGFDNDEDGGDSEDDAGDGDGTDDGDDDGDDGDDDDDSDDDDDDSDDGDDSSQLRFSTDRPLFVNASYQLTPNTNSSQLPQRGTTNTNRSGFKDPKFVFGRGTSQSVGPIIGVVSKKKGRSVISRFGIEKYEEMIFIYVPAQQLGGQGQLQQPNPQQPNQGTQGVDTNGDGIPDGITPNPKPNEQQNP